MSKRNLGHGAVFVKDNPALSDYPCNDREWVGPITDHSLSYEKEAVSLEVAVLGEIDEWKIKETPILKFKTPELSMENLVRLLGGSLDDIITTASGTRYLPGIGSKSDYNHWQLCVPIAKELKLSDLENTKCSKVYTIHKGLCTGAVEIPGDPKTPTLWEFTIKGLPRNIFGSTEYDLMPIQVDSNSDAADLVADLRVDGSGHGYEITE